MKSNHWSRILGFVTAIFVTMTFRVTAAYAISMGSDILITEVMPMSQTNEDSFEYIEIYNNSDKSIDLKDYKLPLQNMDITTSKSISPKGVLVICMKGTTTLESFNNFYGTSLTQDKYITLPFVNEVLSNSSTSSILLAKDDGTVITRAQYNTNDFQLKKSVTYKYPESGFDMATLGQNQNPTPGSININQIPQNGTRVTAVALNKTFITMDVSKSEALYATVAPATALNKSVIWTSSNPAVVEVNQNGVLTSKTTGVAQITVTTADGAFTDNCTVVVANIPVTGVILDKSNTSIDVGKAIVITASIMPENATNRSVIWRSSNSNIASVDINGVVIGKAAGEATIIAETVDGKYTAVCKVVVNNVSQVVPVTGLSLDKTNITLEQGKVVIMGAQIKPSNATNKKITWESSNVNVASVDSNGIVTAKNTGWAWVTATASDGGYKAYCSVTVNKYSDNYVAVNGIELDTVIVQMSKGESETLRATVLPAEATNKSLTWSTDNSSVVSVDSNGKITALNPGIAIITATSAEGKFKDRCIIIVWDKNVNNEDKDVFSLRLNKTSIRIKEGKFEKLTPIINPGYLKKTNLEWTSSNNEVAYVTADGRVYGKKEGKAIITVKTKDGKHSSSCEILVTGDNSNGKGKGHDKKDH
jgi:uncharacterized protein YjdB